MRMTDRQVGLFYRQALEREHRRRHEHAEDMAALFGVTLKSDG